LRRDLLRWFAREKRDLPWRRTRDPYRIWISEAMLQQTRVETVIPFYRRFLSRFPTVAALARARPGEVLAAWSGLGYYRRASALHAAARAVVERHGGRFPSRRETLLELPGIGPYTAGAIASIAFDRPEALVDGNVFRVFSRFFAGGSEDAWSIARRLVPRAGAGNWNQALMELGALICTARDPKCGSCPVARRCRALRLGRVAALPERKGKPAVIRVDAVILAVRGRHRWLLERRPSRGLMAGMWQMPTVQVSPPRPERGGRVFPLHRSRAFREFQSLCELRHTITRHRIRATVVRASFAARTPSPPLAWVPLERIEGLPLTGMTRKCLAAILATPRRPKDRSTPSPTKSQSG